MLCAFDLDETLIGVDCATEWTRYMVEIGWASAALLDTEAYLMEQYHAGQLDMKDYMLFMLRPLMGKSASLIEEHAHLFAEQKIRPHMYQDGLAQIQQFQEAGDTVVVVSASPEFIVRPIAALFGVSHVLGINVEVDEAGLLTGRTEGTLTFQEGKVVRLKDWLTDRPEDLGSAHFFSDSYNDLALLLAVAYPHVVNPDDRLKTQANAANWPVLNWA